MRRFVGGLSIAVVAVAAAAAASRGGEKRRGEPVVLETWRAPTPQAANTSASFVNEPPGFDVLIDEDWTDFDRYGWWHKPTNLGTTEIRDGRLVWTYPEGKQGGSVPGAKVVLEADRDIHGPYQYHRDEGVTVSDGFHGHRSSVNKFRYFPDSSGRPRSPVGFFGTDDEPLTIGINSAWEGPHTRLRWNSPGNLATPRRGDAVFTRGQPHVVETLLYIGTPGNLDGWVKLWLDGVLILHFHDLGVVAADKKATIRGVHFAPVWGGVGDILPVTQTLSVEYSYVSSGDAADPWFGS